MPDQPAILRHWILLRSLGARRQGATLRDLAVEHDVSQKTILRDLELLRSIGFPLMHSTSDHGRRHWKLDGKSGLAQLSFTLEEAAALYLGRQFLEPLAGTDFFHGAQSAFAKIHATLGDAPLRHLEKLAAAFYHTTNGLADYSHKGELTDDLVRAIEDRRLTAITYQSLRATEPVTHYDIHPYAIVWHKQALYLIAHSCDHNAIRTFKVDRISAAEVQELQFTRPPNFDPRKLLAGSFGIFEGDGPTQTVRIRFSRQVARPVSERTHHPTQRLLPQPDGTLVAEFDLSSFEELTSWILSWGQHAEVLEPPNLREQIAGTLTAALARCKGRPKKSKLLPSTSAKQKPR
ncbi:MAG: WYL domain-containing protein [Verrucomicrobiales bacterium]|nr:WYL domain-containing protein [Verrucomicrobiales bacterium]